MPLTIHMIANAHLDPVWLWSWQRGADEAVATCRVACDLLDEYEDLYYSRGEAWVYEQVRRVEPGLLDRIQKHIDSGRWEVVNGWWVQPDCNLPDLKALEINANTGFEWFSEHLGIDNIPVGYNVDSFGHGAFLPSLLQSLNQQYYIMMRPGPGELELPSHLFRWKSPDNSQVLVFRIAGEYQSISPEALEYNIDRTVAARVDGLDHMMCFFGVGNHGGGPTRKLVDWIHEHRNYSDGVILEFSTPSRFFNEAEKTAEQCPLYEGELQYHAIGCYSVCGEFKRKYRKAEQKILNAEKILEARELKSLKQKLAFTQFHDILPGSSIRTEMEASSDILGSLITECDELLYPVLRQDYGEKTENSPTGHRIHLVNLSGRHWSGLAEVEVWTDWQPWNYDLFETDGSPIEYQLVESEKLMADLPPDSSPALLFHTELDPGQGKVVLIRERGAEGTNKTDCAELQGNLFSSDSVSIRFGKSGIEQITDKTQSCDILSEPFRLTIQEDTSDTWSHRRFVYNGPVIGTAEFSPPVLIEKGSLRCTVRLDGKGAGSDFQLFVSLEKESPAVICRLRTNYREHMSVLKLNCVPAGRITARNDLVPGGWITRPLERKEFPLNHAVSLETTEGKIGMVLPDTFAIDIDEVCARPTLIRNNVHAFHNSQEKDLSDIRQIEERFGTDEGPAEIRFQIIPGECCTEESLERKLTCFHHPLYCWDDFHKTSRVARHEE